MQTHVEAFSSLQGNSESSSSSKDDHKRKSSTHADWLLPDTQEQSRSLSEHYESPKWFEELLQQRRLSELDIKDRRAQSAIHTFDQELDVFDYPDRKLSLDERGLELGLSKTSIKDTKKPKVEEKDLVNFIDLLLPDKDKLSDHWSESKTITSQPTELSLPSGDIVWTSGSDSLCQQMKVSSANATANTTATKLNHGNQIEKSASKLIQDKDQDPLETLLLDPVADQSNELENDFIIPVLPKGQELRICIVSNWGDEQLVGMNGIEIFEADEGRPATVSKIFCKVHDQECHAERLLDGQYRTHDEQKIWQCKISEKDKEKSIAEICIRFESPIRIALIRFWNYNKSRIYSYRGVRMVRLWLDQMCIFEGEVTRASGELQVQLEKFGDTILYTIDEQILSLVANHDKSFKELVLCPPQWNI